MAIADVDLLEAAVLAFEREAERLARELDGAAEAPPAARARLEAAVSELLAAAASFERVGTPAAVRRAQAAFRARAMPYLSRSWIMERSIAKPRGYAGDHALLDAFYTGRTAPSGIGRLLDELVLGCAAGEAVVGRLRWVTAWLRGRIAETAGARVVDLACGPCRLEKALLDSGDAGRARFVAIDGDAEALAYARRVLGRHVDRVDLVEENAIRIARAGAPAAALAGATHVVSLGLFDYLPHHIAVRLVRALRGALRPGGELLVGNFAGDNASRPFMEWFGDWPLIHRTDDEFLEIFREAGFPRDALRLERERAGGAVLLVTARVHGAARAVTAPVRDVAA